LDEQQVIDRRRWKKASELLSGWLEKTLFSESMRRMATLFADVSMRSGIQWNISQHFDELEKKTKTAPTPVNTTQCQLHVFHNAFSVKRAVSSCSVINLVSNGSSFCHLLLVLEQRGVLLSGIEHAVQSPDSRFRLFGLGAPHDQFLLHLL
jgi:hypothetical protein